jgi:hypothetical protein
MIGCGGKSSQDKAQDQVCNARADISKQVDELSKLTPATATTSGIKKNLDAISGDLKTIKDSQGKLSDQRRKEVSDANKAFLTQVQKILSDLGSGKSAGSAQEQLATAVGQLKGAYQQTYAKLACG